MFEQLKLATSTSHRFDARLAAILEVFFAQMEQDMEAFLFVQDHLREMWPRVSKRLHKKSMLALLRTVLQQGVAEGAVSATLNLDLLVAATAGTLQQFARMLYFREFKGRVRSWSPELESMMFLRAQKRTQNPSKATSWGFNSLSRHHSKLISFKALRQHLDCLWRPIIPGRYKYGTVSISFIFIHLGD